MKQEKIKKLSAQFGKMREKNREDVLKIIRNMMSKHDDEDENENEETKEDLLNLLKERKTK